jgi:hypothetical protein
MRFWASLSARAVNASRIVAGSAAELKAPSSFHHKPILNWNTALSRCAIEFDERTPWLE